MPKLDSPQTLPLLPVFDLGLNIEDILLTPAWAVNSNSLQYDDSPQSTVMEHWVPLGICMDDVAQGCPCGDGEALCSAAETSLPQTVGSIQEGPSRLSTHRVARRYALRRSRFRTLA